MDMKRLRDLLLTVLGVWLMMAPRVLHFSTVYTEAIWSTWLVGGVIILMIAVRRYLVDARSAWEDLTAALLGVWLIISPWVLDFADYAAARSNALIVGAFIAAVALRAAFVDADVRKWRADRLHHLPR